MAFCRYCGKELKDGEICTCSQDFYSNNPYFKANHSTATEKEPIYYPQKKYLPSYSNNTFSLLAFVFGVSSCAAKGGIAFGILAIIFSQMGEKRLKKDDPLSKKLDLIGFILGIIGISLGALGLLFGLAGLSFLASL